MAADLTATAAGNAAIRRTAAEAVFAADATGRIADFRRFVDASSFSTNVSADKVLVYEDAAEVLDTRRFHVHEAGGDEVAGLARFASAQDSLLARREPFEDLWTHGRRLVYGAVNADGMGTEGRFGPFCLVVDDPEAPAPDALAVFPGDSAQRYTTTSGVVDAPAAMAEATAWSERADLALVERGAEAAGAPETAWPEIVCRPDRYLEAVRAGRLPPSSVTEVRLRSAFRDRLDELQARVLAGDALDPVEQNGVAAYGVVHGWRRAHGTGVRGID